MILTPEQFDVKAKAILASLKYSYTDAETRSAMNDVEALLDESGKRDELGQFAEFVKQQKPADKPWAPVTDYSFESRKRIEDTHPRLIKEVFEPLRVLDAGCGRHGHIVRLLTELYVNASGFDVEVQQPEDRFFTLFEADLTKDDVWPHKANDLVICREVLEHLTVLQVVQAVRNLVKMSTRYVYVTTRFHPAPQDLLDVQDHDDLDPTHITLLNKDFLRLLFVLEGCTQRADLEERMDWKGLGRVLVYEVGA